MSDREHKLLHRLMREIVQRTNAEVTWAYDPNEFSYDEEEQTIRYNEIKLQPYIEQFVGAIERSTTVRAHWWLWSVLHELGHHFTWDDEEVAENAWLRELFNFMGADSMEGYMLLSEEKAATDWAIAWAERHPLEVDSWSKRCQIIVGE